MTWTEWITPKLETVSKGHSKSPLNTGKGNKLCLHTTALDNISLDLWFLACIYKKKKRTKRARTLSVLQNWINTIIKVTLCSLKSKFLSKSNVTVFKILQKQLIIRRTVVNARKKNQVCLRDITWKITTMQKMSRSHDTKVYIISN